jgi:exosortase A
MNATRGLGPWLPTLAILAGAVLVLGLLFHDTVAAAVGLWTNIHTYNHLWLIAPISAYVVWERRQTLDGMAPSPTLWGVAPALAGALAWSLSDTLGINEGRQLGFVLMLQGAFLGLLGVAAYRRLAFPLLYLFLMVPTGEYLLQPLQLLSRDAVLALLRLTGVTVYAEGILLTTVQNGYRIEPGCAGLNYFLASVALSLLYAMLIYRSPVRRALCIVIGLGAAVVANWVRIYLIIVIDLWTKGTTDIVDGHLLYGWGFFAVVVLILMRVGLAFRENPETPAAATGPVSAPGLGRALAAALAVLACGALAAVGAAGRQVGADAPAVALTLPGPPPGWTAVDGGFEGLRLPQADATVRAAYARDGLTAEVIALYFTRQRDGFETPRGAGWMFPHGVATQVSPPHPVAVTLGGAPADVLDSAWQVGGTTVHVRNWNWVAGRWTAGTLPSLLGQVATLVPGVEPRAATLVVLVAGSGDEVADRAALDEIVAGLGPLESRLAAAMGGNAPP